MKIKGIPVATPVPKPDWNQTDSTKADYIKNKPTDLLHGTDTNLVESGRAADAKATGEAIAEAVKKTETDTTLTISGMAADAKSTGEAIAEAMKKTETDTTLSVEGKAADSKATGDRLKVVETEVQPIKRGGTGAETVSSAIANLAGMPESNPKGMGLCFDNLASTSLVTQSCDTEDIAKAMDHSSQIMWRHSKDDPICMLDAPYSYGTCILTKLQNDYFVSGLFIGINGDTYRYKYTEKAAETDSNGWKKIMMTADNVISHKITINKNTPTADFKTQLLELLRTMPDDTLRIASVNVVYRVDEVNDPAGGVWTAYVHRVSGAWVHVVMYKYNSVNNPVACMVLSRCDGVWSNWGFPIMNRSWTLLWENASPTSYFGPQVVSIPSGSRYKNLIVKFRYSTDVGVTQLVSLTAFNPTADNNNIDMKDGHLGQCHFPVGYMGTNFRKEVSRYVNRNAVDKVSFQSAVYNNVQEGNSYYAIPVAIYGQEY